MNNKKIMGFDWLRCVLCLAVIGLHTNIMSVPNQYVGADPANPLIYRLLLYNLFWAAVPTFMTLSLFLYLIKRKDNSSYFFRKIKSFTLIYFFWAILERFLLTIGGGFFPSEISPWNIFSVISSHENIAYFLFMLLILYIFMEVFYRIMENRVIRKLFFPLFILTLVAMFISVKIMNHLSPDPSFQLGNELGFSNILLFLPYLFAAFIVYSVYIKKASYKIVLVTSLTLWVTLAAVDWYLRSNYAMGYNYESLGRPSLVFEAISLVLIFMKFPESNVPKLVTYASGMTMGLYLLHPVVINFVINNITVKGHLVFAFVVIITGAFIIGVKKIKGIF